MAEQAANVRMNAARFQRDEGVIDRILKVGIAALDDSSQAAGFKNRCARLERLFERLTESFTQLCVNQTDLAATDTLKTLHRRGERLLSHSGYAGTAVSHS